MSVEGPSFASPHFRLDPVADRAWAAIAPLEGGAAIGNAGIVDLGEDTLVFDTFISPDAAEDLSEAARALTGRDARYVVNSHYHNDHVRGNQVFAPASTIISTAWTREAIERNEPEWIARERREAPDKIEELESRLGRETDERLRRHLSVGVHYHRVLRDSHPQLRTTLPTLTFERILVLHGSLRTVELHCRGGAHTGSDAFLHLRADHVAYMGDLFFTETHPFVGEGSPDLWIDILDEIEALGVETLVPGHGPVGTPRDIAPVREYLALVRDLAATARRDGRAIEDLVSEPIPDRFGEWAYPDFFALNLRLLHDRADASSGG